MFAGFYLCLLFGLFVGVVLGGCAWWFGLGLTCLLDWLCCRCVSGSSDRLFGCCV